MLPKLYKNCTFRQNFRTRKLGESTEFYAVLLGLSDLEMSMIYAI